MATLPLMVDVGCHLVVLLYNYTAWLLYNYIALHCHVAVNIRICQQEYDSPMKEDK